MRVPKVELSSQVRTLSCGLAAALSRSARAAATTPAASLTLEDARAASAALDEFVGEVRDAVAILEGRSLDRNHPLADAARKIVKHGEVGVVADLREDLALALRTLGVRAASFRSRNIAAEAIALRSAP